MIEIDGAFGEGGGQIFRTSLSLAAMTGQPVKIVNIRSKRRKSGLLRQHLTALNASAEISNGILTGNELGSSTVTFEPGEVNGGSYTFKIGSAGSTTLVLQTLLWPLIFADTASMVAIHGGTHNPMAPPVGFIQNSFAPLIRRMGANVELSVEKVGFAPAGGGILAARIEPTTQLKPLTLPDVFSPTAFALDIVSAHVPEHVADREAEAFFQQLACDIDTTINTELESDGPGNALLATVSDGEHTCAFAGFGERGKSAEKVARRLASDVQKFVGSGAPVDEYLADQLIIPFALAGNGSFRTAVMSPHTYTQIEIVQKFLEIDIDAEKRDDDTWDVRFES